MTAGKRTMDLVATVILSVLLAPLIVGVALSVWLRDGRPVLYGTERMRSPDRAFRMWKFRTMRTDGADPGVGGAHLAPRITANGRLLRRLRLDELPQLWNVLRGDMSFVGPRPPLRMYVAAFPSLYAQVLKARPGVTGLASLIFHQHEERLLARARTGPEADAIYRRACIPRKARLDLIYLRRQTLGFDAAILWRTAFRAQPGTRPFRRRPTRGKTEPKP